MHMLKDAGTWIASAVIGILFVLLVNVSPLGYYKGFGVELPAGWRDTSKGRTDDLCDHHHQMGIPFTVYRQNKTKDCLDDVNYLAFTLNGVVGVFIGIGVLFAGEKSWRPKRP